MTIVDLPTLRRMSIMDLLVQAAEIRAFLVDNVRRTGGHLGPELGAVELTIALHRVFTSPRDPLIFDTGYQAYVHKLLTGRDFSELRQVVAVVGDGALTGGMAWEALNNLGAAPDRPVIVVLNNRGRCWSARCRSAGTRPCRCSR